MYKALMDIGDYKKGDVVPEGLATTWGGMYKISPVEMVEGKGATKIVVDKKPDTPEPTNAMEDDYLNRNKHVVKKNLETDIFDEATLNRLLKLEEDNKNRSTIINTIKYKLRMMD